MIISENKVLSSLESYAFDEVDRMRDELKAKGVDVIDFGVGDPDTPTPEIIRNAVKKAIDERKSAGYPRNAGTPEFLQEIVAWNKKRFGVTLDPATQIASSLGSKEAVFNFPLAFVNPGDVVLVPNPGYPPYERGTQFARGIPVFMNLLEENNYLPDFEKIDSETAKKAKIMWLNYPNNPTASMATESFFKKAIEFCRENEIILVSDEAYSEMYFDEKPHSILEYGMEGIVAINSLSKRSAMTGYRVGWLAGDEKIIKAYKKLKGNIDSGTATFIQDAATEALKDEAHVEFMRNEYQQKRDILLEAFDFIGLPKSVPAGTFYIWQKVPEGYTSVEFSKKMLAKDVALVATPGSFLSEEVDGVNPGDGFVRFALVPSIERTKEAARRIKTLTL